MGLSTSLNKDNVKKCRAEFNNKRMTATSDKCRKHRFKFFSSFEFELEFEFEFVLICMVFCQRVMLSIDSLCHIMKEKRGLSFFGAVLKISNKFFNV